MLAKPRIMAKITFLSPEEGGRSQPAFNFPNYRPHVVVGDPAQRKAVFAEDGRTVDENYLGVNFMGSGTVMTLGHECEVELELVYFPHVDYSELKRGATFTIREGAKVVGYGEVQRDPWDALLK